MTLCIIPSPLCLIHIPWRVQPTSPTHPKQRHSRCGTGSVTWSSTNVTKQPLGCKSHKKRPVGCLHEGNLSIACPRHDPLPWRNISAPGQLPSAKHTRAIQRVICSPLFKSDLQNEIKMWVFKCQWLAPLSSPRCREAVSSYCVWKESDSLD